MFSCHYLSCGQLLYPYLAQKCYLPTYQERTRSAKSPATELSVSEGHWVAVANSAAAGVLLWYHRYGSIAHASTLLSLGPSTLKVSFAIARSLALAISPCDALSRTRSLARRGCSSCDSCLLCIRGELATGFLG